MGSMPWILVSIGILILLLLVAVIMTVLVSKKKRKTDYYALFVVGIIWLPFGIATKNSVLFILGLVLMAVGLMHKKEWKKNHLTWKKLSKNEKKARFIILAILLVLLVALVAAAFLAKKGLFC